MSKTDKDTLISIVMPAFNSEKYIEVAITSVINQSYPTWELIVIDDCSKDNTVQVIRELSKKDERIRFIINGENLGVSATRNKGISLANGNWIAFLDSDDMWEESKLQKQMTLVEETGAEFLFTGSSFINEAGEYYKGVFDVPKKVTFKTLRMHNVISCSSVLIMKKFFEDIKMERDDMHEDYAVWLKVLKTGVCAYGINEPLLIYRISRTSKSGNKLKTIQMTYKVFRFIGMNPISSLLFVLSHIVGSLRKYWKIL